jgi:beta-N-acetylhexosaminidase
VSGAGAAGELALGSMMLAFDGLELPEPVLRRLTGSPAAGVTLFRFSNVETAAQVRALSAAIQAAARARPGASEDPLLIAADHEGGQLIGLGDATTPFAGNMALGAAGDAELAERVAKAIGRELLAMGVNVNYAPVCDLATNARNPVVGIRSFGDDPARVGELAVAFVSGLQSVGVAAGIKHFPGIGDVSDDMHHGLPLVDADRLRLEGRELVPFRAAIAAGARVVMSAHLAIPALTGDVGLPATLAPRVMSELLREGLGFDGVSITDALDMRALAQGPNQVLDVLAALRAGVDLLLTAPDAAARERIESGLAHAARRGLLDRSVANQAERRVGDLRRWLAGFDQPDLAVVRSGEHLALADELAARALTLVRDDETQLPLRPPPGARIAAIMPIPTDQTPADTSSTVLPGLAGALRRHHPAVEEIVVAHAPDPAEIATVREAVRGYDLVVVGTTAALLEQGQAALVEALLSLRVPLVTVALRTPFDLAAYPGSRTHVSTYGILQPSLDGLADGLFGAAGFRGRLPAAIPDLYPTGHGILR